MLKEIKQIDKVLPVVYYNKKRRYAICYSNEEEISKKTEELKTIGKETGGDKMKKLKILGKLLNILGIKKPVSF